MFSINVVMVKMDDDYDKEDLRDSSKQTGLIRWRKSQIQEELLLRIDACKAKHGLLA